MLNAWGINHLHLGLPDATGLVTGLATGQIAFAWVTTDRLHLIDVRGHAFDDAELLEIVHSNWPELLASTRTDFDGVPVGDPAIAALRRKSLNCAIKMRDGTNYMPAGGGHMLNGYSPSAVRDADMLVSLAEHAQAWCASNPRELRATFEQAGPKIQNLSAKLLFYDGDLLVQHSETGARFRSVRP